MSPNKDDEDEQPSNKFHTVQAERDLEANWEVDLANKLEDYLLKICSGEIAADDNFSVNFAEAALLLQGSIQVYSRKVEYLYNLVLHAFDFLSQKRQQELSEDSPVQHEQSSRRAARDEEDDQFWVSDDVPVEPRNTLDASISNSDSFYHFVKPPANLVVLEGDCLDTIGDGGELDSYLLATNDLYRDFILLDPSDAAAVNEFLDGYETGKGQNSAYKGSSPYKSFQSPSRRSGGTGHKSSVGKNKDANLNQPAMPDYSFDDNNHKTVPDQPACDGFDLDGDYSVPGNMGGVDDDDNDDDPWKPLNPHEPGTLRVKPFKTVKPYRRNGVNNTKQTSLTVLFPLAKMHGTISPELNEIWETRFNKSEENGKLNSPALYEKLRQSLSSGGHYNSNIFGNAENDHEDNGYDDRAPDFEQPEDEMPKRTYMDEDLPPCHEKYDDSFTHFDKSGASGHEDPISQASLEDLCRSHLDALLANIAETENQTELVTRVSSWKQKIEHSLEEQEARPPFDIHDYGERILGKLSLESENEYTMSFADVVKGQEKHDVARTFSALLQLVNNGDVNLERSSVGDDSVCYTGVNPFHVRLLNHEKGRNNIQFRLSKKRIKSPLRSGCNRSSGVKFGKETSQRVNRSPLNSNFPAKLGKVGGRGYSPEGKKRRRA